jgi:hypothetical protein
MTSKKQDLEQEFDRIRARIFKAERGFGGELAGLREQLAAAAEALEVLKREQQKRRFIMEPGNGSVITFQKKFGNPDNGFTYGYAAIRSHTRWFLTQDGNGYSPMGPKSWDELREFIGDADILIMAISRKL